MRASDGMKITIVDVMGKEVSGGFIIPDENINDCGHVILPEDDKLLEFAKRIFGEYNECVTAVDDHYQKSLDNCTCFWKDKPEAERILNRSHSSECGVWNIEQGE